MKIRQGFVSNSSSASFIVKLDADNDEKLAEYVKKSDSHFDEYWDGGSYTIHSFWAKEDGEEIVVDPQKYTLQHEDFKTFTTMFNDWTDVPGWKFIRAVSEGRLPGVKLRKIIQTEDEYDDVNIEVSFNEYIWEIQDKKEHLQEDINKQKKIDIDYYSYLNKFDLLTEEEKLLYAKGLLD